jgi:large subunit ribosomal protein L21
MFSRLLRPLGLWFLGLVVSFMVGWLLRERQQQKDRYQPTVVNRPPVPPAQPQTTPTPPPAEPVATEPVAPEPKPRTRRRKDDLTLINGIGPSYARALNAAGINTFAELAAQDAQELLSRLQLRTGVERVRDWIEQAKQLSK